MTRHGRRLAAILAALAIMTAHPAPAIETGSGVFILPNAPGDTAEPLRVFYHRPAGFTADSPILFVMHGVQRNADVYRDNWVAHAERYNALVLVPEFSRQRFPTDDSYNLGNMVSEAGERRPVEAWSFAVIDQVFDQARTLTGSRRAGYLLFGHSAGAQFAHRLVTFMPRMRAERVVSANSGWYTLPVQAETFPYGLAGTGIEEGQLRAALARPLILLLGEADTDPNHRFLRRTPEALRQGPHRFARGQAYFATAEGEAERLGTPFAWKIATVPGIGHDNKGMAAAAARLLLE